MLFQQRKSYTINKFILSTAEIRNSRSFNSVPLQAFFFQRQRQE